MRGIRLKAYAKINPFLAVGQIMPNGYHEIRTIFQTVALSDTVEITKSDGFQVECTEPSLSGDANLSAKAIRFMKEWINIPPVKVWIEKSIPLEAGLGGGSSDAGSTIVGINRLFGSPLSQSELLVIARACGADVPFFVLNTPRAYAKGDGSELSPLPPEPPEVVLLAKPRVAMPTSRAYELLDAIQRITHLPESPPENTYHNDFDSIAPPESQALIQCSLDYGATHAHLCGSGSAVYAIFPTTSAANECALALANLAHWKCVTTTLQTIQEPEWM